MNIALGIEYRGSAYCGWQRQSHSPSVQQSLEEALSEIANHKVEVFCAGRTDTGVHANGQVVNFELQNPRPEKAWTMGANTLLPDDICVTWAKLMPNDFHARHSATARRYRYVILNRPVRSANLNGMVTWVRTPLNEQVMHHSAQALLGENDFSSFQAASCQSQTPFRYVSQIRVIRWHDYVVVDITANAFLHHMVRNIVGSLIEVGAGREGADYMAKTLAYKDRTKAAMTARPDGLYLVAVSYPDKFAVPDYQCPGQALGPLAIPDDI